MQTANQLTLDNCVAAFIDHQPFVAFPVRSISPDELANNVAGLAKVVKALDVPAILTTIMAQGGPLADPLFQQLQRVFPEQEPIDRRNTNSWADPRFVDAVTATGRTKLILSGLWTEVCVAQTALSAIEAGYEVYVVSDASGGVSAEAHQMGMQRMIQAGARPLTWLALLAELCPDNTSPEYQRMYPIVTEHGGGVGIAVQYVLAQLGQGA